MSFARAAACERAIARSPSSGGATPWVSGAITVLTRLNTPELTCDGVDKVMCTTRIVRTT